MLIEDDLPELPAHWKWSRVGDLVDPGRGICYGIVQPGKHDPSGVPMVNSNDVLNGRVAPEIEFRVSEQLHSKFRRSTIRGGELLLTLVGANFGRVAIAPERLAGYNCSRAVGILPVTENADYVMYCLRSPLTRHYLDTWANTTAQPTFNLKEAANLPVPIAPPAQQKAIAHILGALDDKIELNRRMNATLEGMAQALFKSWFVDFDPVIDNALAAGNPIPDELAPRAEVRKKALAEAVTQQGSVDHPTLSDPKSLFPAAFEYSDDLGWIPEGWETSTIDDECEIVGGGTPSTKNPDFWEGGEFPWVTPKDFSALQDKVLLSSSRFLTQAGLDKVSSGLLPKDTVLMSSRAPVGYLAITKIETAINQGFIGMICNKRLSPEYVLQWADSRMDDIKRAAGGSTFAEISKKAFRPFEVVIPSHASLATYTATAGALYDKIADGILASNTLTKLRDTLLPKLISGEVHVPDAEQFTTLQNS